MLVNPFGVSTSSDNVRSTTPRGGCSSVESSVYARSASAAATTARARTAGRKWRSEEHTSELQSQSNLVCRLLLEKKKKKPRTHESEASHTSPPTRPDHPSLHVTS